MLFQCRVPVPWDMGMAIHYKCLPASKHFSQGHSSASTDGGPPEGGGKFGFGVYFTGVLCYNNKVERALWGRKSTVLHMLLFLSGIQV